MEHLMLYHLDCFVAIRCQGLLAALQRLRVCVIVRLLPAYVILYLPVVVSVSWRKPVGTRASAEEVQGVTIEV